MVDVTATHPDYDEWLPSWTIMRHVVDGEEDVKNEGAVYLPEPTGFVGLDPDVRRNAYAAYKTRAQFPDILAPTIRGMVGVIHRKAADIVLPQALEPMRERATRDGLTLDSLHRRITREVLVTGRFGLLADMPSSGGQPYLAGYTAEAIRNWGEDDDRSLAFVMLDEKGYGYDTDQLTWEEVQRYRLLQRDEAGRYIVRRFEGVDGIEVDPAAPVRRGNQPLGRIPFVFIDTNDLTPEPDEVPLLGLARIALAIYRLDADYRQQLYMTGQEMLVYIGADAENLPEMVGAGVSITLPQGADAKVIGPQGTGIAAHRTAIQDDFAKAVRFGAQMMGERSADAESGEALRLRYANQTATLTTISLNVAAGLERALKYCAEWAGANPDEVAVTPNTDFVEARLSAPELTALVNGWMQGAFSKQTLYENLQRGEIASRERDFDEERLLMEEEMPALGTLGEEMADALDE